MKKIPYKQYLEPGEKIKFSDDGHIISFYDKVIVSDRNIICFEWIDNSGFFKKREETLSVTKYPLKFINIINGRPSVRMIPDRDEGFIQKLVKNFDPEVKLEIDFTDDVEEGNLILYFNTDSLRSNLECAESVRKFIFEGLSRRKSEKKKAPDNRTQNTSERNNINSNNNTPQPPQKIPVSGKCKGCRAPISGFRGETIICTYCDTRQVIE